MLPHRAIESALACIRPARLIELATSLIATPSPTGEAGPAADRLAELLADAGVAVERHDAGYAKSPAVCVRLDSESSGLTLQFDGHLDVVPLPFSPPTIDGRLLRGSGAADMKAGLAAAVEAVLALRDAGWPRRGSLLLTAHDLHEAPWGNGSQLDTLIDTGVVGNAVMIPEPLWTHLPVRGRGQACWAARVERPGPAIHEVLHPADEPKVISAAADLAMRVAELDRSLQSETDPIAGRSTAFVGQIHSGEIYNQSPQFAVLEGTRRWIPGMSCSEVEADFRRRVADVKSKHGVKMSLEYRLVRDAFALDESASIVRAFQDAMRGQTGKALVTGQKPFVDDGNSFWARAGVPAITHGPRAGGQHTINEWVDIVDLVRVAHVYVETAIRYWSDPEGP